jgi:hypothetical protein
MAADFELIPLYGQQPIVRNRTSSALNFWAGQTLAESIPATKPTEQWVRLRIMADRVTRSANNYLDMAMSYYTQQDSIQSAMRDLMDGFPTEAERTNFTNNIMVPITPTVMLAVAANDVTQQQVEDWWEANGFGEPEEPVVESERTPRVPT